VSGGEPVPTGSARCRMGYSQGPAVYWVRKRTTPASVRATNDRWGWGMDLGVATTAPDIGLASIIKGMLESAGIDVVLRDEGSS